MKITSLGCQAAARKKIVAWHENSLKEQWQGDLAAVRERVAGKASVHYIQKYLPWN